MYKKTKCRARIYVSDDKIVKILKEHNYLGDAAKVEVERIYENIRTQTAETMQPPNVTVYCHLLLTNVARLLQVKY